MKRTDAKPSGDPRRFRNGIALAGGFAALTLALVVASPVAYAGEVGVLQPGQGENGGQADNDTAQRDQPLLHLAPT